MPHVPIPRKRRLTLARHGRRSKPRPDFTHNPYRWYVADYDHTWVYNTLQVTVTTDVPCHLNLQYTSQPSRMHMKWDTDSGYRWMWNPYYCFVEYTPVDQTEPGDTLTHTFVIPAWNLMETKWWIFTGTMFGAPAVSVSCIFRAIFDHLFVYLTIDALGPILRLTLPTLIAPHTAYHPIPLTHQHAPIDASYAQTHWPWLFHTAHIIAVPSIPLPHPPHSIVASFQVYKSWLPPIIATIDADHDTEVT